MWTEPQLRASPVRRRRARPDTKRSLPAEDASGAGRRCARQAGRTTQDMPANHPIRWTVDTHGRPADHDVRGRSQEHRRFRPSDHARSKHLHDWRGRRVVALGDDRAGRFGAVVGLVAAGRGTRVEDSGRLDRTVRRQRHPGECQHQGHEGSKGTCHVPAEAGPRPGFVKPGRGQVLRSRTVARCERCAG